MESSNPTLNEKMFRTNDYSYSDEHMTSYGAYQKTTILLALCVAAASFTWSTGGLQYIFFGLIGGLIFALVTIFKKEWSPVTAPLYAISEGVALGGISFAYQASYPGIVLNAIILTFSVMAIMLYLFASKTIRVTDGLKKGIVAATGAIFIVYLVGFVMSFFGKAIPFIHSAGPIGIGFSLVVVGIASFNLLLDFDFIQRTSETGRAPKYMEWFAAFGLMVTLVWLYLEILRLLSKLNNRR